MKRGILNILTKINKVTQFCIDAIAVEPVESQYEVTLNDPVTGAYNKTYFDYYFRDTFYMARRNSETMALLLIEIEQDLQSKEKKSVHKQLTSIIQDALQRRDTDHLFRYSDTQFRVLLPKTTHEYVVALIERVMGDLEGLNVKTSTGASQGLSAQYGVYIHPCYDRAVVTPLDMIKKAEVALAQSKEVDDQKYLVLAPEVDMVPRALEKTELSMLG